MVDRHLREMLALDSELAEVARPIRILERLAWPPGTEERFLEAWRAGRPALPAVRHAAPPSGPAEPLASIQSRCDRGHPLGELLFRTAGSYRTALAMLEGSGTPEFTRNSIALYGRPDDPYQTQDWTGVDAAEFFLSTTDDLLGHYVIPPAVPTIPSGEFAARLRRAVDEFFTEDEVAVVLDPRLTSKAIAGSKRIRVRDGALFSELDFGQLLNHEAFIHTATMLNGKRQPSVRCLALGAPRTTRAQEGLAVLAELMTLSIDIVRLRRIALRVRAVKAALSGADFLEVFRAFLEAGQSEEESYKSAQRIFRGGDVRGRVAFTKDCVYLKGLLEVHAFLRVAIRENRPELVRALFAGRLTLGDAVTLSPLFEAGVLSAPVYVPAWARDLRTLASVLAYSAFMTRVELRNLTPERFVLVDDPHDRA
jgi:uncharacterized protein (TIGR02421 family)